jgi:hypothetical protein
MYAGNMMRGATMAMRMVRVSLKSIRISYRKSVPRTLGLR